MPQSAKKAPGKREARKIDRREAIVEVAKRQFLDNGYAATSMSAIAAELGGSKATLWSYFPNKEDLFAAVLDEATAAYRQQFADLLRPSKDMPSAVLQFTRSFMAKLTLPEPLRLHRLIVAESGRNPELGQLFFERAPGPRWRCYGISWRTEWPADNCARPIRSWRPTR
jgi:AcrR family transcriptional regulator